MYELKKIGKVLTSKSVGTVPSSYETRIRWLRNAVLEGHHSAVTRDPEDEVLYCEVGQSCTVVC